MEMEIFKIRKYGHVCFFPLGLFYSNMIHNFMIFVYSLISVVVEEAAEVLEAHIVASLTQRCQQVILIG